MHKKNSGFSLIELLSVLAIVALATSFLSVDIIRVYESYKVREEVNLVRSLVKKYSYQAYIANQGISLNFTDKMLQVEGEGEQDYEEIHEFKYVSFNQALITLNRSGSIEGRRSEVDYKIGSTSNKISFIDLVCCK